jgi:hypothetical protein
MMKFKRGDEPDLLMREYRKTATVKAVQMNEEFEVLTPEGLMKGHKGDYLCKGSEGELWPVRKHIFEKNYELVDE